VASCPPRTEKGVTERAENGGFATHRLDERALRVEQSWDDDSDTG
jgi:hypothetical protein